MVQHDGARSAPRLAVRGQPHNGIHDVQGLRVRNFAELHERTVPLGMVRTRVKPEAGSGEYEQQMRYMLAHGHDEERAAKLITGGYVQSWAPGEEEGA